MVFNSAIFLVFSIFFFPIFYLSNLEKKKIVLLVFSYMFYMWAVPLHGLILAYVTAICFIGYLGLEKSTNDFQRKFLLVLFVPSLLAPLFFYKYLNFFSEQLCSMFSCWELFSTYSAYEILLPIGISFYTFQSLSLFLDKYLYLDKQKYSFIEIAIFISFFPQLVAGPIERAKDIIPQFSSSFHFKFENLSQGLALFAAGMFGKVLVADNLSTFVSNIYSDPTNFSGAYLLLSTYLFGLQIYFDFAGYSLMAIGIALTIGINLSVNFNNPYGASSVKDFWRRWHITLGNWFKTYVYIPLGGNKSTLKIQLLSIMLVFTLSGFWHGANWTFIVWGICHAFGIMILSIVSTFVQNKPSISGIFVAPFLGIIVTNFFVFFCWIFFRANDLADALNIIDSIGDTNFSKFFTTEFWGDVVSLSGRISYNFYVALLAGVCLHVRQMLFPSFSAITWLKTRTPAIHGLIAYVIIISILFFGNLTNQSFIYFQF